MENMQEFITETKTEVRNGVKYTTHYVNRSIRPGDPQGGSVGMCINGISKTTEIINYIYQPIKTKTDENNQRTVEGTT